MLELFRPRVYLLKTEMQRRTPAFVFVFAFLVVIPEEDLLMYFVFPPLGLERGSLSHRFFSPRPFLASTHNRHAAAPVIHCKMTSADIN
jgi:hypothetical protein